MHTIRDHRPRDEAFRIAHYGAMGDAVSSNVDLDDAFNVDASKLGVIARRLPPGYRLSLVFEEGVTDVLVCVGYYPWSRRLVVSEIELSAEILTRAAQLVEAAWIDMKRNIPGGTRANTATAPSDS